MPARRDAIANRHLPCVFIRLTEFDEHCQEIPWRVILDFFSCRLVHGLVVNAIPLALE